MGRTAGSQGKDNMKRKGVLRVPRGVQPDEDTANRARSYEELAERYSRLQEAYADLRGNEERYRIIFDNLPLGYMSMDESARIIDVNKTFSAFFGYAYEEIVGKFFAELLAEGVDYHRNVSFPAFKRTGVTRNIVWKVLKKDGSTAIVSMNGRVRYDERGKFIQTHCMMMDITEHRKAEDALRKSEREKALILGTMSERVVYHDEKRRIIWANRVAGGSSGIAADQLSGRTCFEAWRHRSKPCGNCPAMMVFETHKPQKGEVHVDGKILEITAHPVLDENDRFVGVVQISNDITERRSLEKEVLELSSKERNRLGHDLHDGLGQYLTGISFTAKALYKQLAKERSGAGQMAQQIIDSADMAKKLMRSILQGLCPVPEEPRGLVSALSALASNMTDFYRVPCSFVCENEVLLDDHALSTHLFFIAHEAVSNAIKHSGCSRIRIFLGMREGFLNLSVGDDGRGISPEPANGRGMGLRIMRYRASIIGATLEVGSMPGEGTSVICHAPFFQQGND